MTIQIISDQIKTIQTKWRAVVTSRPGEESAVKNFFGPAASYSAISSQIDRWLEQISRVASKPRVSQSLPKNLVTTTARSLSSTSRSLDSVNNGVEWIFLSGGFGQSFLLSDYLISELVKDSSREQTQIVDAAQARLSSDLKLLQDGSEIANRLKVSWPEIEDQLTQIDTSTESIATTLSELSGLVTDARTSVEVQAKDVAEKIKENQDSVVKAKTEFDAAIESAQSSLDEAESIKKSAKELLEKISQNASNAEKNFEVASGALEKATSLQTATHERLTLALRDAQMEGLAGSFTRMANTTEKIIKGEQGRFDKALVYLVVVGILALVFEFSYGFSRTAEEFSFRLVRTLSLAAPGIWIAWIASRKLSALNRVFTDYQYKSASALAYESYRQTVADASSDELKQQLLAFAIRSFGENPTHYFDTAKSEAVSPLDSWLDRLPLFKKPSTPKLPNEAAK